MRKLKNAEGVKHFTAGTFPKKCYNLKGLDERWGYLFYNPVTKFYKIGISKNINERLRRIRQSSGIMDIRCVAYFIPEPGDNSYELEQLIHGALHPYRIGNSEWFNVSLLTLRKIERWLESYSFEIEAFSYDYVNDPVDQWSVWDDLELWASEEEEINASKNL